MNRYTHSFIVLITLGLVACSSKQESTVETATPSKEVDTETLKANLKSQVCAFLTIAEVATITGIAEEMGSVSGYDGTTGHYCSYNWNDFGKEIKFAYVFSTFGNIEKVAESLAMFKASDSLEPVSLNVGEKAAFWGEGNSRLSVFYTDVQLYVDMRKTDFTDKKSIAIKIVEKALE
ncbi:MAG: hypothetical protein JNK44_03730 [Cyclobacteriaceae bacterium]|nr:hypothetical protein [Cyclobacteriaceae bacterium]